ncbi:MAG TPA: NADH-quinone oxidoreductase subunit L [Bacteriovoracaceae bacterium]|nr:NADH-quinone oxidoreductase subunit L [Bacteriovoracaceae bacterium]
MEYTVGSIAPIFLSPVIAFVINAFFGRRLPRNGDWLATLSVFISFVFSARIFGDFVFGKFATDYFIHKTFTWFDISYGAQIFKVDMGIYIDNMAAIMLLMVSGVATLIHLFSIWYMDHDVRHGRFFTFLPLFTSAMLGLVLSDNLFSLFIFWEIMGFCSYSLIGIYYEKEKAGDASIKAFMTTRVGDVFLLLGIVALWMVVGSVAYVDIYGAIAEGVFTGKTVVGISLATFAGLCIFLGGMGKSAQFPLHVWLPDAMMGPTPGSALIHAATMVAAGVYLALRMYPLMVLGDLTWFIAVIGAITAFGAATIALVQTDIKAVLAFSTISQLGYMMIGVGVGSYNAAFMHLITHAVFKACLFLSAGSIIHTVHEQEMPKLGGLRKQMPYTFFAMMCCTLAIAGIPFFSGFVSKDRILGDALYYGFMAGQNPLMAIVPILGFAGAGLTAFYMFRMMFLTFFGESRAHKGHDDHGHGHGHAAKDDHVHDDHGHDDHGPEKLNFKSNVPLLILTVFTFGFWYAGTLTGQGFGNVFGGKQEWFKILVEAPKVEKFVSAKREAFSSVDNRDKKELEHAHYHHQTGYAGPNPDEHKLHTAHTMGAIMSIIIAFSGVFLAFLMYIKHSIKPFSDKLPGYTLALKNKYYFDKFYEEVIIKKGLLGLNRGLAWFDMGIYDRYVVDGMAVVNRVLFKASKWFDNVVIDAIGVDGTGVAVNLFNLVLRIFQSGKIQFYFIMLIMVLASYIWTLNI